MEPRQDVATAEKDADKGNYIWFTWPSWLWGAKEEKKDVKADAQADSKVDAKVTTAN